MSVLITKVWVYPP